MDATCLCCTQDRPARKDDAMDQSKKYKRSISLTVSGLLRSSIVLASAESVPLRPQHLLGFGICKASFGRSLPLNLMRIRLGSTMVVRLLRTRLKGLEALLLSHGTACSLIPSLDMICLPLTALFAALHCYGARYRYRTGDAEAAC